MKALLLLAALSGAETMTLRGPLLGYKGRWSPEASPTFAQTVLFDGPVWLVGAGAAVSGEDGAPLPGLLGDAALEYGRLGAQGAPRIHFPPDGTLELPEGFGVRLRPGELHLFQARLKPASPPVKGRARVEARLFLRRPADGPPPVELEHFERRAFPRAEEAGAAARASLAVPVTGRLHAAAASPRGHAAAFRLRLRRGGVTLFDGSRGEFVSADGLPVRRGDALDIEESPQDAGSGRQPAGVSLFIRRSDPRERALDERPGEAAYEPARDDPHAGHGGHGANPR